ncbi:MAG: hypothetical protein P8Y67_05345 [Alphaproteobacteria bacterium]
MSDEFDASLVWDEPVSAEVQAEHTRQVDRLLQMPNAFDNARLHAQNEMRRLISVCNRLAWRSVPKDLRAPSAEEKAALLERLSPEDREKLMNDARLAAQQRLLVVRLEEAHEQYLAQMQAEPEERNDFDASLVYDEPVGAEIVDEQVNMMGLLVEMPSAFENAQRHAESDLQRLVQTCNDLVWRGMPADMRAPTAEEKAALLERLSPDDQERLMRNSQLVAQQRSLLNVMKELSQQHTARLMAEQAAAAEREAHALLRAEFEEYDAAGKEQRFEEWLASRTG